MRKVCVTNKTSFTESCSSITQKTVELRMTSSQGSVGTAVSKQFAEMSRHEALSLTCSLYKTQDCRVTNTQHTNLTITEVSLLYPGLDFQRTTYTVTLQHSQTDRQLQSYNKTSCSTAVAV